MDAHSSLKDAWWLFPCSFSGFENQLWAYFWAGRDTREYLPVRYAWTLSDRLMDCFRNCSRTQLNKIELTVTSFDVRYSCLFVSFFLSFFCTVLVNTDPTSPVLCFFIISPVWSLFFVCLFVFQGLCYLVCRRPIQSAQAVTSLWVKSSSDTMLYMLCYPTQYHATPRHAIPRHTTLYYITQHYTILYYTIPHHTTMRCNAMRCDAMRCDAMRCVTIY